MEQGGGWYLTNMKREENVDAGLESGGREANHFGLEDGEKRAALRSPA